MDRKGKSTECKAQRAKQPRDWRDARFGRRGSSELCSLLFCSLPFYGGSRFRDCLGIPRADVDPAARLTRRAPTTKLSRTGPDARGPPGRGFEPDFRSEAVRTRPRCRGDRDGHLDDRETEAAPALRTLALAVADANCSPQRNSSARAPADRARTLLLSCIDYTNAMRRGLAPWAWGKALQAAGPGYWERDLVLPPGLDEEGPPPGDAPDRSVDRALARRARSAIH